MGCDAEERIALSIGFTNAVKVGMLKIAYATMDYFKMVGRGGMAEIPLFHEGD